MVNRNVTTRIGTSDTMTVANVKNSLRRNRLTTMRSPREAVEDLEAPRIQASERIRKVQAIVKNNIKFPVRQALSTGRWATKAAFCLQVSLTTSTGVEEAVVPAAEVLAIEVLDFEVLDMVAIGS